ncbi:zinc-ribbon domain-containing protein [Salisaeta longa]|uniref:zinc-ribbon domain-containing protein n=1 Tax=Salisaeta longa TaxID=503170 RepID=UPI0003B60C58|nr:zinc-ribbon domain-containing protein [Salisaeta longa]
MPSVPDACPACGLELPDDVDDTCPYCGYEFPGRPLGNASWIAWVLAILLAWPAIKGLLYLFG